MGCGVVAWLPPKIFPDVEGAVVDGVEPKRLLPCCPEAVGVVEVLPNRDVPPVFDCCLPKMLLLLLVVFDEPVWFVVELNRLPPPELWFVVEADPKGLWPPADDAL